MRTKIVIDNQLTKDAMQPCGACTKRDALEQELLHLVRINQQQETASHHDRRGQKGCTAAPAVSPRWVATAGA